MSAVARIIDANANRAREALRVMEDAARFALDDAETAAELKGLRHDLRSVLETLPPGWLAANRNVAADVGTSITTESERRRRSVAEMAVAAGKRLTEALRAIEEAAKIVDPAVAARVEALRYRAYEADGRLQARLGAGTARQWPVAVLVSEAGCRRPWLDVVRAAVAGGAACVQLREKTLADAELLERARRVIAIARPAGCAVVVNDRVDVALAAGADGVHVGRGDLPIDRVRAIAGTTLLVGASTHDAREAAEAVSTGADYCGVGTIFDSTVKPGNEPAGVELVRRFVEAHPATPHLAIGGITAENAALVVEAGGRGVAVSTAVCAAEDPRGVVEQLRAVLEPTALRAGETD